MKHGRRIWQAGILVGLVGLIACCVFLFRPEPLLLQRATKIAGVSQLWPKEFEDGDGDSVYYWVSDTVLFSGAGSWRLQSPFLYDIRSHQKTPLSRLSLYLQRDSDLGTGSWALSPDRHWLLWTMELYNDVRAARLDGSGYQVMALPPPGNTVGSIGWEDDSRQWRAEGFDYASGKETNVFGGDVEALGKRRSYSLSAGGEFFQSHVPEVDEEGRYVEVERSNGAPASTTSNRTRMKLLPPPGMKILEVVPSNQGDRLGWVLLSTQEAPLMRQLRRYFLRILPPASAYVEICTTRWDGQERRVAGRLDVRGSAEDAELPRNLKWLPSEKKINFRYQDALWTIPTD